MHLALRAGLNHNITEVNTLDHLVAAVEQLPPSLVQPASYPWRLPIQLRHFDKEIHKENTLSGVVMGGIHISIPHQYLHPLWSFHFRRGVLLRTTCRLLGWLADRNLVTVQARPPKDWTSLIWYKASPDSLLMKREYRPSRGARPKEPVPTRSRGQEGSLGCLKWQSLQRPSSCPQLEAALQAGQEQLYLGCRILRPYSIRVLGSASWTEWVQTSHNNHLEVRASSIKNLWTWLTNASSTNSLGRFPHGCPRYADSVTCSAYFLTCKNLNLAGVF